MIIIVAATRIVSAATGKKGCLKTLTGAYQRHLSG